MIDNEIIKALEYCNHNHIWQKECFNCEYATFEGQCGNELIKDALKLINRQQAKIEELKKDCKIEVHVDEVFQKECEYEIKQAGTEAVKKFAEALKAKLKNLTKVTIFGTTFALVGESFVDSFVEKYEKGERR